MLAKHTPQSMMQMEMLQGRWVFRDVEQSKTLDHYESYGIREVHRVPMHLHNEAFMRDMINNEQVAHLIKNNIEMMRVNVGSFVSILCHTESISDQNQRT